MADVILTQESLKELLDYDPITGIFTWKTSPTTNIKSGRIAGHVKSNKYVDIRIQGKPYKAHRLAWLYVYGYFPKVFLDHINRNPSDNRIENLREATNIQNCHNRPKSPKNTSGYKGVSWDKKANQWRVTFKHKYVGLFKSKEHAYEVYKKMAIDYVGEFFGG